MDKNAIRRPLIKERQTQKPRLKQIKDIKIMKRLLRFAPFQKANEFFTYLSHRGEVSTDMLLGEFLGHKKIIVPKLHARPSRSSAKQLMPSRGWATLRLCLYELQNADQFKNGKFGIREPLFCAPKRELRKIDVALIPGVAFDITGHRIGFGGGYFDRLLKKLHCTTIGLAYEFQIIDKVPAAAYDVPVDFIITEKRLIKCQRLRKQIQSHTKS